MTQETKQEQGPTPAGTPAVPVRAAQPSRGRAAWKKAIIELTEADLRAVNGGGSKPGISGGANAR